MKQHPVTFLFFIFSCGILAIQSCKDDYKSSATDHESLGEHLQNLYDTIQEDKTISIQEKLDLNKRAISKAHRNIDSMELKFIAQRSGLHRKNQDLDSAIYYAEVLVNRSLTLEDSLFLGNAYFRLGFYNRLSQHFEASLANYYLAKELYIALGDSLNAGRKLLNLANLLNALGNYNEAELTAVEGLTYIEDSKASHFISGLYNALAISSKEQKNYGDAQHWYDKALSINSEELTRVNILNNKAAVMIIQKEYDQAISILEELLSKEVLNNENSLETRARVLDNLGHAQSKLQISQGIQNLLVALEIRKKIGYQPGQFTSYLHLADYYKDRNQDLSIDYARKAYALSISLKNPDDIMEALGDLIDLEKNPKEYSQAYIKINDSVNVARQNSKNQYAKIKYESEKNKKRNLELTQETNQKSLELQKTKNRNLLLLSTLVILLISAYFVYRSIKAKHLKNQLQQAYKTEARISKTVHDELANDLFNVMHLVEENAFEDQTKQEKVLDNLEALYARTRNISTNNAAIDTGANFPLMLKGLLSSYRSTNTNIIIKGIDNLPWTNIESLKKIACYRVLQELMVNMKKHSMATLVLVEFKTTNKKVIITYRDNGVGLSGPEILLKGGLQNAENRMAAVKGVFTFESNTEKGFKSLISFPL